ncbi:hypothetical protein BC936DRAFT_150166 [Jimgerdemannia flammicorona]|uniref:Uncharacterized protein n=1 Tax=Jimgerdemannia flammicorona TaxID=994334 RepID=A0A433CZC8_9FUNG|nr:hypothetical protein BC936DRAFT_150166 [Jimgerdemannia flammicorona]
MPPSGRIGMPPSGRIAMLPSGRIAMLPSGRIAMLPSGRIAMLPSGRIAMPPSGRIAMPPSGRIIGGLEFPTRSSSSAVDLAKAGNEGSVFPGRSSSWVAGWASAAAVSQTSSWESWEDVLAGRRRWVASAGHCTVLAAAGHHIDLAVAAGHRTGLAVVADHCIGLALEAPGTGLVGVGRTCQDPWVLVRPLGRPWAVGRGGDTADAVAHEEGQMLAAVGTGVNQGGVAVGFARDTVVHPEERPSGEHPLTARQAVGHSPDHSLPAQ